MRRADFKEMWEAMQRAGYFADHAHYADWFDDQPHAGNDHSAELDVFGDLDEFTEEVVFPGSYSDDLERLIKRTEPLWFPRLFPISNTGTALDVGCGFGRSLDWMHRVFDRVIGVDISEHAIELAGRRLAEVDNVELHVGEGDGLPPAIAEHSVDFIFSFNVFEHIPRPFTKRYLEDFRRVLKPGGMAVFNLLSGSHEWTRSGKAHTEWSIGYSQRAITRLVRDAGLEVDRRVRWCMENGGAYWTWAVAVNPVEEVS